MQLWGQLLSPVQDYVIDQPDGAKTDSGRDQNLGITHLFKRFQRFAVDYRNIINGGQRLFANAFMHDFDEFCGFSLTLLERYLGLTQRPVDHRCPVALFVGQDPVSGREGEARFFSHRREAPCGRMATLIWLERPEGPDGRS